jgi:hypothetical protein
MEAGVFIETWKKRHLSQGVRPKEGVGLGLSFWRRLARRG